MALQGTPNQGYGEECICEYPGAFGDEWSLYIKNDENAQILPTFNEMMNGIFKWYIDQ